MLYNFHDLPQVKFAPWVGKYYAGAGLDGARILIVGESHYHEDGSSGDFDFTANVVRERAQSQPYIPFFAKIQKLLCGIDPGVELSSEERVQFWESVAFYNFVQSMLGKHDRPSPEMWKEAAQPFLSCLNIIDPQIVLVLGEELKKHLPTINAKIRVIEIPHPSSPKFMRERAQCQTLVTTMLSSFRRKI